jgi:hypothetical protein
MLVSSCSKELVNAPVTGGRLIGRRVPSFSQRLEQERRRWAPFRRALSAEDQAVFDRLFACITQHVQGDVSLSWPWSCEAVIVAVLLDHEKRIAELVRMLQVAQTDAREV